MEVLLLRWKGSLLPFSAEDARAWSERMLGMAGKAEKKRI